MASYKKKTLGIINEKAGHLAGCGVHVIARGTPIWTVILQTVPWDVTPETYYKPGRQLQIAAEWVALTTTALR